jgi:hypothetical protein
MTYDEPYLYGVRTCRAEDEEGDWMQRAKRVRVFRQNATDATFVELTFEGAPLQRCQPTILPIADKLVVWGGYTSEEVATEPVSAFPTYVDTPVSTGAIYTDFCMDGWHGGCGVRDGGAAECWFDSGWWEGLVVPSDTFTQVACGFRHYCGLTDGGAIRCWGEEGASWLAVPP